jgi:formylglycine-generating enzyme required for sulfatase activity
VGTWEFVSAKTADGRENQGYIKALKDKQYIKMITPTHSIVLTIDPASGKITGAHGGACLLGNGEFTEWPQYDTDSSKVRAKSFRLKVRFEGDKLVQSFEDGSEQTWRRAEAADVTTAPSPPASAEPKVTPPAGMAKIPAGSFTMGDANDGNPDGDAPLHTVYVSAFYMDTNLVAYSFWCDVYQWAANHGYNFDNPGSGKAAKHPVQQVNWYDGVKWCNARSEKEGRTPAYYTDATHATVYRSGRNDLASSFVNWNSGYRLPTEAEWEKAARGGVSGQRFPWGNTINWSHANYRANPDKYSYDANRTSGFAPKFNNGPGPHTSPVGCFAPNGYGLYDMAGNLFEQCWDWYGSYESSGQSDPRGPASGTNRTYRGGSWSNLGAYNCRTAIRTHDGPANKWGSQGFRCVLPAGQP